jgi:hypothetical protein
MGWMEHSEILDMACSVRTSVSKRQGHKENGCPSQVRGGSRGTRAFQGPKQVYMAGRAKEHLQLQEDSFFFVKQYS